MISTEAFLQPASRPHRAASGFFALQFLMPLVVAIFGAASGVGGAATETQDSASEVITATIVFDGTEGSTYNLTRAGAQGAELGLVTRNITLGRGAWGEGAILANVRNAYPGNLSLAPSAAANEVFHARSGAAPRDRSAAGATVWTAASPTDSYWTVAFDQDGDGFLDDAIVVRTGVVNRYYTYNQIGTQIAMRNVGSGTTFLNDVAAIDSDSNGILDQFAVAHNAGSVYVERATGTNVWTAAVPNNAPALFVAGIDLNADGFLEGVLAGADDFTVDDDEAVYAYNATGALQWTYYTGGPTAGIVNLTGIEVRDSGFLDGALVATNDSVTALDRTGGVVWNWSANQTVTAAAAVDFDRDGVPEGAAYADAAGGISFIDGTGALIAFINWLGAPVHSLAAADFDGDGYSNEVVAANDTAVLAVDSSAQWLWNNTTGAAFRITMVAKADFDGNGTYGDVIVATTNTLYAFNRTGAQRWNQPEGRDIRSFAFIENPSAAGNGSYTSPPLDASTQAAWADLAYKSGVDSANENISAWLRFGDGSPGNITWGAWQGALANGANLTGNTSRFAQMRFDFGSTLSPNSANLSWFRLNYTTPAATGFLVTAPLSPAPQAQWLDVDAQFNLSGGQVRLFYSPDGIGWHAFTAPAAIDGGNVSAPALRFRIEMDVGATSPNIAWIKVRYAQPGLRPIVVTPVAGSAQTGIVNVTATADPLITAVSLTARNLSSNTSFALGPATFDGATSRWYALWDTSGLNGTTFGISATAVDARGFSFTGSLAAFEVDNAAPALAFTTPPQSAVLQGSFPVGLNASADAVSVQVSYIGANATYVIGAANETSPGVWSIAWDTIAAGIGEEGGRLSATATDHVGLATTVEQRFLVVDNVAPWIRIDDPLPGTSVEGFVTVNMTAATDVVTVELIQDGSEGFATLVGTDANGSHWVGNWSTFPTINDTSVTLVAVATDRAGHLATDSVTNLSIDNSAPIPVLIFPTLPGAYRGVVHLVAAAPGADAYLTFAYRIGPDTFPIANISAAQRNTTTSYYEFDWDTAALALDFTGATLVIDAAPQLGQVGTRLVNGLTIDNTGPIVQFITPGAVIPGGRIDGNYTVEVYADIDTAAVTLWYMDLRSAEVVALGNMTHVPASTHWRIVWTIGTMFVPYAKLIALAVDGVGLNGTDERGPLIIGLNPNDSPPSIVRAPNAIILDEDFGTYEINITGLIVDDDPANVSVYIDGIDSSLVTLRNNGSVGVDGRMYLFSVQDAHSGSQPMNLQLRVVDASGQTDAKPFTLYIQSRNDPPSWVTPHDTVYVEAGVPYEMDFSFYVHDVEFEKEGLPLFISTSDSQHITQNGTAPHTLSLIFSYPEFGNFPVDLSLTDGDSAFVPQVHAIHVVVTDDAIPRLTQRVPDLELLEDTPKFNILDLHDYFVDPDEEPLFYYNGTSAGFGLRIEAGVLSIEALPANWSGKTSFFLGARDFVGAYSETRVNLTVLAVNDPPAWDFSHKLYVTDFFVHFDVPFVFDLGPYVYDVDSNRSAITVFSSSPEHAHALRVNSSEGEPGDGLVLVIAYDVSFNNQTITITLFASDGEDNSTTISVRIHVSDNYPPEVAKPLPPEIVMLEGSTLAPALRLSDYFSDPDKHKLFYAFGLLNVNVTIDQNTSEMSLRSEGEWSGTETLILRAVDDREAFKDSYILITVLPVNDPPRITAFDDYPIESGTLGTIWFTPHVSDPDSPASSLTFTVSTAYPGALVSISNGNISFVYPRPKEGAPAPPAFDTIRFCASDGDKTQCKVIAVRIIQPTSTGFNWLQFFIFVATAGVGSIVVARHFVEFKIKRAPTVEDIFLVYEDGILIKHISKNVRKYADEDVVTSMLSAIQSFAADSFEDKGHWELREVQFQGRKILIEKARKFQIILIFDGDANEDLKKAVLESAEEIEAKYRKHLKDWDGDPSHFDGVERIFAPLMALESAYIPGEVTADELVKAPLVPGEVYVSEAASFAPLLKAYAKDLEGLAVVRVRPATDAGHSIEPLKPDEVQIVEVTSPKGDPEEEGDMKTGLDIAIEALKEALEDSRVAVRGRAPLVLFEGFEWILDRYGFVFSKKFSDQLKKLASAEGFYLFVAVDATALSPQQLEGVERGAIVFRGA